MRQFMQRYDLLVTPSVAVPAFDAGPAGPRPMTPESMLGWTPFSYPFNLTQQPAITIPCGLTAAGLPIGLQIVGPMFADALVLRAARAYEQVRPRDPPVAQPLTSSSIAAAIDGIDVEALAQPRQRCCRGRDVGAVSGDHLAEREHVGRVRLLDPPGGVERVAARRHGRGQPEQREHSVDRDTTG